MEPGGVLTITGPTATGKTKLSVELCRRIGGEVISADSMQVYRRMDIGTAKPTQEEMGGIPHHMINVADPEENYSVSRYVEDATDAVDSVISRGAVPVIAGGTGLYIESLVSGRNFAYLPDSKIRKEISDEYDRKGGEAMHSELKKFDAEAAARISPNDKRRIIRAFEVWRTTGKTITQHNEETKSHPPRYSEKKFILTFRDRNALYERIDARTDDMIRAGLLEEVRELVLNGVPKDSTAMQAIGYKELVPVVEGKRSVDDAVEEIKRESRRYAKRQLSWFRRDQSACWILWEGDPDYDRAAEYILNFIDNLGKEALKHQQNQGKNNVCII